MRRIPLLAASLLFFGSLGLACSSAKTSGFEDPNAPGNGNPGGGTLGGGPGGSGTPCSPDPGNYDIPGNNCDDDGDGTVDNPPTCDDGLSAGGDAEDFAKAIGICATASKDGYGLVSASFTRGFGVTQPPQSAQHGILPKFGDVIKPREGARLGVLSTGYAQEYNGGANTPFGGVTQTEMHGKDWYNFGQYIPIKPGNGRVPPGFPKAASGCNQAEQANDVINLKLTLKAPKNASGVKFDFNFYSGEWPAFICSEFNDAFIAYLSAKGFNGGKADNMSFDKDNNPVSVNNGFFDRCTAGVETGCASGKTATSKCPGGAGELGGTGFGINGKWCGPTSQNSTNGGATGWLTSQAPVQPGEEFTLEFIIWDTGDAILDSSVLIDNFSWGEGKVDVQTDRPR
ncbi:MAG: choice-of-anchor L domain-containing protein [Labilithrix sp.]|nr:choice-of-anchor L domain-containing protein [Labilithrix sp.]